MAAETTEAGDRLRDCLTRNRPAILALAAELKAKDVAFVATNARGSSDHACALAKFAVETELGLACASLGPSIASLYGRSLRLNGAALLSVSQSGRSPDIVASQAAARAGGALTIAIVNDETSPLAGGADIVLPLHVGPERSVAATKSALASMALAAALVGAWADARKLSEAIEALPEGMRRPSAPTPAEFMSALVNAKSLYVLGRGPTAAVAAEAALKLKETCAIHAEAFSSAEVLHGPAGIIEAGFPVLAFLPQDQARAGVEAALERLEGFGARILVVDCGKHSTHPTLETPNANHPLAAAITALHRFYGVVETCAHLRGRDPDRPPNLSKITQTV